MKPSDFLTLLGLAFTAWAIIASKERRFILLFFSKLEYYIGLFLILFIHFLFAFDWVKTNWFSFLKHFTISKGIPAADWAYIFALFLVVYPIIKINFGFFSKSRLKDLISLYRTLFDTNEIDLLAGYINKYHLNDTQLFLKQYSTIHKEEGIEYIIRLKKDSNKAYEKIISKKRILFGASVYGNIITDEDFIKKAANKYPELFASVIKGMESTRASNQDFAKLFIATIYDHKNQKLVNELKILSEADDSIKARCEYVDLPIMEGLMANTKVAADNYVWYPVAELAMKSMKYENDQLLFLQKKYDDKLDGELWQQKIYIAIVYFNYMVRETIYRDSKWHMWLFYYHYFVEALIKNIPEENIGADSEYSSFNHYLIKEIIDNIVDWLELAVNENTKHRTKDSQRCLGKILIELSEADCKKLNNKYKIELFESVIGQYFRLSEHEHVEVSDSIMKYMEGMFKNPGNPDLNKLDFPQDYRQLLAAAWDKFDKVPFQGFEDNGSIERFENEVLLKIGIVEN